MRFYEFLSIGVVYLILLLSVFDAHITVLLGVSSFLGVEMLLLFLLFLTICVILYKKVISRIEIYTVVLLAGSFLTSLLLNFQLIPSFLGMLFLFKIFLFFIVGKHLIIRKSIIRIILFHIVLLAIFSAIISFVQLFVPINPFGFHEINGKVMGIFENANKHAIFLLVGFIITNFYFLRLKRFKFISTLFFIAAIIISGSRQAVIVLLIILLLYYIFLQKKYIISFVIVFFSVFFFISFQNTLFERFDTYTRVVETGDYFRLKALILSADALIDHPFGVGVGFWGGKVADVFESKYHAQYKLFSHWEGGKKRPDTIDMYWPHALVELGVLWFFLFSGILYRIVLYFKNYKNKIDVTLFLMLNVIIITSCFSMLMAAPSISAVVFIIAGVSYNNKKR